MIVKYLDALSQRRIVLASQSPRREQLLNLIGLRARKHPSRFEENLRPSDFASSGEYAVATAMHKAKDVAAALQEETVDLIIAADTVVDLAGAVLEKPCDKDDAVQTLLRLAGRDHWVYTGVTLLLPSSTTQPLIRTFVTGSQVWFEEFEREEAAAYVETGEPMDKAGSYGIQGMGGMLVKKIDGCYFNVMGLPVNALAMQLKMLIEEGLL